MVVPPPAGGPGGIRKQAEQIMRSQPVSSVFPWPLCQLLPPASCLGVAGHLFTLCEVVSL